MRVSVLQVGVAAGGLRDWPSAFPVLSGSAPYVGGPLAAPAPLSLAPNERRRATLPTRLALEVARQALSGSDAAQRKEERGQELLAVFASADAEMDLIDSMCRDIYQHRVPPSPTEFQNSVHNSVAGYWAIAEGCRGPCTSLAASDGSFAAGLIEAVTQARFCHAPVLLVAYDVPGPALLDVHRHYTCAFACALLLRDAAQIGSGVAEEGRCDSVIELELIADGDPASLSALSDEALEAMRLGNPAARALPLLEALARAAPAAVRLPYLEDLLLEVRLQ